MLYKDKYYEFEYFETTYTNNTNPYLEIERNEKWNQIIDKILSILEEKNIKLKSSNKTQRKILTNNLSVWIARNLMENKHSFDPFFPHKAKYNEGLIETFIDNGNLSKQEAKKVVSEINVAGECTKACKSLSKKIPEYKITKYENYLLYQSGNFKYKVFYPKHGYEKLKKNYNGSEKDLNNHVFCLFLRYKTLAGSSHQFSMETKFKDALTSNFNCRFECFASGINFHYPMYGSLFYDIEKYFGSYGSFYHIKYIKGFYIANPPYEPELLLLMVNKFITSLKESRKSLSISFGLPTWGNFRRFEPLEIATESHFKMYKRCFERGEVYWYDTLNNRKITIPSHCRFVLQNGNGKKKYSIEIFKNLVKRHWMIKK